MRSPSRSANLRKVVGSDVIASVPGRGYRFVAPIDAHAVEPCASSPHAHSDRGVDAARIPGTAHQPALRTATAARTRRRPGRAGRADRVHRLVSIIGAGGIGKSLLAQHLLDARRGAYPHGVCWIELARSTIRTALPGAVTAALGVHGGRRPLAALLAVVAPLTMLLALDNAEHLLAGVASLCRALHEAAPGVRLVVTSQAPLRLAAERVFRVGPLAVPDGALPASQALTFGAVALFADRAQAVDRTLPRSPMRNAPALIELPRARRTAAGDRAGGGARADARHPSGLLLDAAPLRAADRAAATAPRRRASARCARRSSGVTSCWPRASGRSFRRLGVVAGSASLALSSRSSPTPASIDLTLGRARCARRAGRPLAGRGARATTTRRATGCSSRRGRMRSSASTPPASATPLQRRHALAVAAMLDAAYDEYFGGRVGADDWLRRREPDLDNARDALHWARAPAMRPGELRIGATMLRALPPSLHAERMALADACEARIEAALPEPLQQKAWLELSCVLADTQKGRGRGAAAERALALARRLDASRSPIASRSTTRLCRAASAAAQADDLQAARAPLDEVAARRGSAVARAAPAVGHGGRAMVARTSGDTAEALRLGRRLLALDRERGSHASIAVGNLIDAELAAGDAGARPARRGAGRRAARHAPRIRRSRLRASTCAALLALDDVRSARRSRKPPGRGGRVRPAARGRRLSRAVLARSRTPTRCRAPARLLRGDLRRRDEVREANEAAAMARALKLAQAALGEANVARQRAQGAALRDCDIETLAFGIEDADFDRSAAAGPSPARR